MQSPSYFCGIVKVLENPKQKVFNDKITSTQFRALIPQIRKKTPAKVLLLTSWGGLGDDVKNYYKMTDYILIEGYLSIKHIKSNDSITRSYKKGIITVLKAYPFFLRSNNVN